MNQQAWHDVDAYLAQALFAGDGDPAAAALEASRQAGLPPINVSPLQGKLLYMLARLSGASRALEIGTLGGYSAIWLARALPPAGRLVTLEVDPHHAEVARANLQQAGLASNVEVRVGAALDGLAQLAREGAEGSFDLCFIDADKPNNPAYLQWALRLARPGGLVVMDNVVRDGKVADAASTDPAIVGTRQALEAMGAEPGVEATALQTVGAKGYDGFAIAIVGDRPS
jgi:predicted O-methyltransferase YrrM